jgi:AcrR family transcriptional regulator
MKTPEPPRRRGRPRSFDESAALEKAMGLFWQNGYEATSVDDLAAAMEITPPSLYNAFGSKEELFLSAFQHYLDHEAAFFPKSLAAATAREVAEQLLFGTVDLSCGCEHSGGCLVTQTATLLADKQTRIGRKVLETCQGAIEALTQRFERAIREGDLPAGTNPCALARYLYTVVQGITVQAAWGATREQLVEVVEMALRVWPPGGQGDKSL